MSRIAIVAAGLLVAGVSATYASQHVIGQKGRLFNPGKLTVTAGDPVVFQNDDSMTHHIYSSTHGQEFNLETMKPGDKASHTFGKKGRVDVRCGLHPGMRLVVTVQ
jgi:plastocyanin